MPILINPRHEHFAQLVASGMNATEAYVAVGYSRRGAHASAHRLQLNSTVGCRLAELRGAVLERTLEKAAVDRAWIIERLKSNVERPRLENLVLAHGAHIDDTSVAAICKLRQLKTVDLRGTRIGSGSLRQLAGMRTLRKISVSGAGVTAEAVAAFRQTRPDCEVIAW